MRPHRRQFVASASCMQTKEIKRAGGAIGASANNEEDDGFYGI